MCLFVNHYIFATDIFGLGSAAVYYLFNTYDYISSDNFILTIYDGNILIRI